jgi:hypothetical protein
MTSIAVYHQTVPNAKNQEKVDLLRFFAQGARCLGEQVIDVNDFQFCSTDVAVIQGWIAESTEAPHLRLRNQIIQVQIKHNRRVVAVDSNLFLYATPGNPQHYLRYSFNGVFPNTGIYCDTNPNPVRWQQISRDLGIHLKDYRTSGNHILLFLQRNGGWSMGGYSVVDWAVSTITKLRQHTQRPIRLRPHPGDRQSPQYCNEIVQICNQQGIRSIEISINNPLLNKDLKNCWATVNHNSSPVIGAAIEGWPVFVTDPTRSQCAEIANTDLAQIENPQLPDRQKWVERLAMSHWNFVELQAGACWSHMRQFI